MSVTRVGTAVHSSLSLNITSSADQSSSSHVFPMSGFTSFAHVTWAESTFSSSTSFASNNWWVVTLSSSGMKVLSYSTCSTLEVSSCKSTLRTVCDSCSSSILSCATLGKNLFSSIWVFKVNVSSSWFHASIFVSIEANVASCCAGGASSILVNEFSSIAS